jgi:hypothetical protein
VEFSVPAGEPIYIGAPAKPIEPERSSAIARACASIATIKEAHLPLIFVKSLQSEPRQVLVIVLEREADRGPTMKMLIDSLSALAVGRPFIDVWPLLESNSLLPSVRKAGVQIVGEQGA